jgi:excisionase family DNA binding protein
VTKENEVKKLLYRPDDLIYALGISRSKVYQFLKSGQIKSFKMGNKRYIKVEDLEEFINNMESE